VFKTLLEMAQQGILPEKQSSSPSSLAKDKDRGTLKPFFGASADFTTVAVTTASGRKVEISATQDGEVIESEIEERDGSSGANASTVYPITHTESAAKAPNSHRYSNSAPYAPRQTDSQQSCRAKAAGTMPCRFGRATAGDRRAVPGKLVAV